MKEEALRRKTAQKNEDAAAISAKEERKGAAEQAARKQDGAGTEETHAVSEFSAGEINAEQGAVQPAAKEIPVKRRKFFSASNIAKIAMFAALATVLQLFRIPLPFIFPSFLELNFADIPALIGTFALGPVAGSVIVVIKLLLKLLIQGTGSAFVGDLSDLFCGLMLVVPAGLIYKYHRTFKGALVALAVGTLCSTGISLITNRFIIIPAYVQRYGFEAIIGMVSSLFPSITQENFYAYYLPLSCLPFNLLRCLIASGVTLLAYKRISRLLNKF